MAGLKLPEYATYWGSVIQRAFPEHAWRICPVHPYSQLEKPHLVTAMPEGVWKAISPLVPYARWIRPHWSLSLNQKFPLPALTSSFQTRVDTWWESDYVLWLQRDLTGWTHARIRRIPQEQQARIDWLNQALQRTPLDVSAHAQINLLGAAVPQFSPLSLLVALKDQWHIHHEPFQS